MSLSGRIDNFVIETGTEFKKVLTLTAMDLSGYRVRMWFKHTLYDTTFVGDFNSEGGGGINIHPATPNGQINIHLPSEWTYTLTYSRLIYAVEIIAPGTNEVTRLIHGVMLVRKGRH